MNEQSNINLIQNVYGAFSRGDVQSILDSLTDDVQWTLEGPEIIPYTGKRQGVAEVRGFFTALAVTQENQKLTIEETYAHGDCVMTVGRYAASVPATGKTFDSAVAHFFTIRDGKIARFLDFGDTAAMADAYVTSAAAAL